MLSFEELTEIVRTAVSLGVSKVRLTGGDYAAIRATVTGERITPLGQWTEWIASAAGRPDLETTQVVRVA